MKTLSFNWDDEELAIFTDATDGIAKELLNIEGMFDKKAYLATRGWAHTKIDGVLCWHYAETVKEALEVMVSLHDFFYYQNDNIDTFLRGEGYLRKLNRRLEEELSPAEAVALWNKYAPKELQKPLPE